MLDHESLEMIAQIIDQKLEANNAKLESSMDAKLEKLESRMDTKLNNMEQRLNHKINLTEATLNLSIAKLDTRVARLEDGLHNVRQTLELKIEPQIQLIAENYLPAVKRMEYATSKINEMQASIDVLNLTVAKHSELLQCTA